MNINEKMLKQKILFNLKILFTKIIVPKKIQHVDLIPPNSKLLMLKLKIN